MTESSLLVSAEAFANRLNNVVKAAIDTEVRFVATVAKNGRRASVRPSAFPHRRSDGFPLARSNDAPDSSAMFLLTRFFVEIDPGNARLRVVTSSIGLWVDITGGRKAPRPLIRVEYDRRRVTDHGAAAHVHVHAHSPELAWTYGSGGRPAPSLAALHFPVGGHRFRTTLEDFLFFLDREKLYTDFKSGWKPLVLGSLRKWKDSQAASTVRRYPRIAVHELEKLGYTISPPGDGTT